MIDHASSEPRENNRRYELIKQLESLGPRLTTRVVVNGRTLLLDAAIRLVERLPDETGVERRGILISVAPDPFISISSAAMSSGQDARPAEQAGMLTRLIERQDETDRLAEEERRGRSWRHRLARLLTRTP